MTATLRPATPQDAPRISELLEQLGWSVSPDAVVAELAASLATEVVVAEYDDDEEPAARAGLRTEVQIATWMETDDPHGLVAGLVREMANVYRGFGIAVSDRLSSYHLLRFQAALPDATWSSATPVLRDQ